MASPGRMRSDMNIVILGLSITSSWGNGHATTYRGIIRELNKRGHRVLFLERDVPWYAKNRDMPKPDYCEVGLYSSLGELQDKYENNLRAADLVILGSYVPEGVSVGEWICQKSSRIKAFYDIDTPVTLAKLAKGDREYLAPELIPEFDLYLSFTGGPTLDFLERHYGARMARPLYCSVDTDLYAWEASEPEWDLGYIGTYSPDRQKSLNDLLIGPAVDWPEGRFIVAGPLYPEEINWPGNVKRIEHLAPLKHPQFYNKQRFTLNLTRLDMKRAGYSPSVRLFEAAGCGTPIISDYWPGLEDFFTPGKEILLAKSNFDVLEFLNEIPERERYKIGQNARKKVLASHTAAHRARELEGYITVLLKSQPITSPA